MTAAGSSPGAPFTEAWYLTPRSLVHVASKVDRAAKDDGGR